MKIVLPLNVAVELVRYWDLVVSELHFKSLHIKRIDELLKTYGLEDVDIEKLIEAIRNGKII